MLLVGLGGATFILLGLVTAFAPQLYRDSSGFTSGNQIPSVLELAGAIACLFYGLVWIGSLQALRQKSQTALLLIQCLGALNIIFSLFRFPLGLFLVLFNVLALILATSNTAKSWVAKS
jgi:hypothetical protein